MKKNKFLIKPDINNLDYDLFIGYNNAHENIVRKIYEEISICKSS